MKIKSVTKKQRGATMPEYALVVALVAVVSIAAWTALGTAVSTKMNTAAGAISSAGG